MKDELNASFDRPIPKYVLCPGFVFSRTDKDRHFITASRLAALYRVPLRECVVKPDMEEPRNRGWYPPPEAIELYPQYSGDYTLPTNLNSTTPPVA